MNECFWIDYLKKFAKEEYPNCKKAFGELPSQEEIIIWWGNLRTFLKLMLSNYKGKPLGQKSIMRIYLSLDRITNFGSNAKKSAITPKLGLSTTSPFSVKLKTHF